MKTSPRYAVLPSGSDFQVVNTEVSPPAVVRTWWARDVADMHAAEMNRLWARDRAEEAGVGVVRDVAHYERASIDAAERGDFRGARDLYELACQEHRAEEEF